MGNGGQGQADEAHIQGTCEKGESPFALAGCRAANFPKRSPGRVRKLTGHAGEQVFEATVNRGGGAGGAADRKDGKCSYKCYVCLCAQPSEKSLQIHWDAKHTGDLDLEKARVK